MKHSWIQSWIDVFKHWAWLILAICFVDLFINYSVRLGYGVVMPEIIRDLNINRTASGSIYNAYFLSYISLTPVMGYLTDRVGGRPVITFCSLMLGLGALLMGTVHDLTTACLFYAITGLGAAGLWTPIITVIQRWFVPNRRGLALGIINIGPGLGFATIGVLFPWIVSHYTWRYSWYFLGVAALVMVILNGLLLRSDPFTIGIRPWGEKERPQPNTVEQTGVCSETFYQVLKYPRFWFIGLSYLSISYSLYGLTTFMIDYAIYELGIPLGTASFLATVHGIAQTVGVLMILPLSDYLGRKRTITISNTLIAVSLVGILLFGSNFSALLIFVGFLALFYGATFPLYGACAGDYFSGKLIGTVAGAWTPLYGIGAISSHWVNGFLRDITGSYQYGFVINVALAVSSIVFISFAKLQGQVKA